MCLVNNRLVIIRGIVSTVIILNSFRSRRGCAGIRFVFRNHIMQSKVRSQLAGFLGPINCALATVYIVYCFFVP